MDLLDLHHLNLLPAHNDCDGKSASERLPRVWQARRDAAAGAVGAALRERGISAGMCARWWQEAPQRAAERLRGTRPLCAEHLAALPPAARAAALEALKAA